MGNWANRGPVVLWEDELATQVMIGGDVLASGTPIVGIDIGGTPTERPQAVRTAPSPGPAGDARVLLKGLANGQIARETNHQAHGRLGVRVYSQGAQGVCRADLPRRQIETGHGRGVGRCGFAPEHLQCGNDDATIETRCCCFTTCSSLSASIMPRQ